MFSNKGKEDVASWAEVKKVTTSKTTLRPYNFPLHYMISCLCGLNTGRTSFRCALRGRQVRGHTSILVPAPHTAWTRLCNNISLFRPHKESYSTRNINLYEEAADLSVQPGCCSMRKCVNVSLTQYRFKGKWDLLKRDVIVRYKFFFKNTVNSRPWGLYLEFSHHLITFIFSKTVGVFFPLC